MLECSLQFQTCRSICGVYGTLGSIAVNTKSFKRYTKGSYRIHIPYTSFIILLPPNPRCPENPLIQQLKQQLTCTYEMLNQNRRNAWLRELYYNIFVCLRAHTPLYLCRQPPSQRTRTCQSRWARTCLFNLPKIGTNLTCLFQNKTQLFVERENIHQ